MTMGGVWAVTVEHAGDALDRVLVDLADRKRRLGDLSEQRDRIAHRQTLSRRLRGRCDVHRVDSIIEQLGTKQSPTGIGPFTPAPQVWQQVVIGVFGNPPFPVEMLHQPPDGRCQRPA